tara:strand:+ start:71 stop:904 length:834 start_codon:yes stop_codon:yes gene_type:complete
MPRGLGGPPETKRRAPLRATSCKLVSGLVLLWCLPMEQAPNVAALLNEELRAPCHCTDEANHAGTDQRATIELPRAPITFEDTVPTTLLEQRAEGTSGWEPRNTGAAAVPQSCSVLPVAPPFPLTLLQLVLLAVIAWRRAPRGNKSTVLTVLPTLLCLFVPKALAQQCSSAPTCSALSTQSGLASKTCWMKQYAQMWDFDGGSPVAMPGKGLYTILKVAKDESNCCYDLEVQGFMCEVMKNKTAVRASPAVLLRARQTPSHRSEPSLPDARRCTTQP